MKLLDYKWKWIYHGPFFGFVFAQAKFVRDIAIDMDRIYDGYTSIRERMWGTVSHHALAKNEGATLSATAQIYQNQNPFAIVLMKIAIRFNFQYFLVPFLCVCALNMKHNIDKCALLSFLTVAKVMAGRENSDDTHGRD